MSKKNENEIMHWDYGIYIHNINAPNPPPADYEMSPTIEGNQIFACRSSGIAVNALNSATAYPYIRHNLIRPGNHIPGEEILSSEMGYGITLYSSPDTILEAKVRSSQVYRYEIGIEVMGMDNNTCKLQCNVVAYCEWCEAIGLWAGPVPSFNLLIPFLGNMLHPFTTIYGIMPIGPSGTLTINSPAVPMIATDTEIDLQGVVVNPNNPSLGAFTRRILLDVNM